MLNNTNIKKESYGNVNQILFAVDHQVSVGVMVDDSTVTADSTGKKIVKAGTPLTGNLDARTTPFTAATTTTSQSDTVGVSNAVGVLLHDVDVTVSDANGTLLLFGFVNTNRLDTATKAKITQAVKNALPMIKFMAC